MDIGGIWGRTAESHIKILSQYFSAKGKLHTFQRYRTTRLFWVVLYLISINSNLKARLNQSGFINAQFNIQG